METNEFELKAKNEIGFKHDKVKLKYMCKFRKFPKGKFYFHVILVWKNQLLAEAIISDEKEFFSDNLFYFCNGKPFVLNAEIHGRNKKYNLNKFRKPRILSSSECSSFTLVRVLYCDGNSIGWKLDRRLVKSIYDEYCHISGNF